MSSIPAEELDRYPGAVEVPRAPFDLGHWTWHEHLVRAVGAG